MNIKALIVSGIFLLASLGLQAAPTVGFNEAKVTAGLGDTITLDIVMADFPRTEGGGLTLKFNPKVIQVTGVELNDDLWSAKLLLEDPEAIRAAHLAFLEAGADCIITSSYQATYDGFLAKGLSNREIEGLLTLSVDIAVDARDTFWSEEGNRRGHSLDNI